MSKVDRNDYLVHKSWEPSKDSEFPYLNSVSAYFFSRTHSAPNFPLLFSGFAISARQRLIWPKSDQDIRQPLFPKLQEWLQQIRAEPLA